MPKEEKKVSSERKEVPIEVQNQEVASESSSFGPAVPTSLNEEWKKLVDKNPNRLIGCGG